MKRSPIKNPDCFGNYNHDECYECVIAYKCNNKRVKETIKEFDKRGWK